MTKPKVFLTGGDGIGWAVDEDLKLVRQALSPLVEFTGIGEAEIIHSLWWYELLNLDRESLVGKRIICHFTAEPFSVLTYPRHNQAIKIVGKWITRTGHATEQLRSVGLKSDLVPYLIDVNTFKPLEPNDPGLVEIRNKWKIPEDKYLIGSFQRDTEGADLISPKLVKGPDILLEILLNLQKRGVQFHVVLAGPRRGWLLRQFETHSISNTYVGEKTDVDDIYVNAQSRETLNLLYNLMDLYVVSSRSEGGPHAILEASAAKCKIICRRIGMAADVLDPECLYDHPWEAAELVAKDAVGRGTIDCVEDHFNTVQNRHRPERVTDLFRKIYSEIDTIPVLTGENRVKTSQTQKKDLTVGLWHSFFKPPYGGGNQFMMALRKAFMKKGVNVVENELNSGIDAYVLNSIHFDVDRFLEFGRSHRLNILHRIDGPISLIRGYDLEKDELCYDLNAKFASATVLQSAWVRQRIRDLGYTPVSPTIIHNAIDSDIFHSRGRVTFDRKRKIKLISTSWSNNPRKGGPIYKWIEDNLDWDRFDYTFVGNASENFKRIKQIPPVPSEDLAGLLRSHDIYITASRNDPCSNALIEALACGLPALFMNDGGHPELVGVGGLPFTGEADVLTQLDILVENYESLQRLITVNKLDDVAEKYLSIIREIVQ